MNEPRRYEVDHKVSGVRDRAVLERQMALYFDAYAREIRHQLPQTLVAGDYALRDVDYTMTWWRRFAGEPVLVNKLRGRDNAILELNDLIRPETLERMGRITDRPRLLWPYLGWLIG